SVQPYTVINPGVVHQAINTAKASNHIVYGFAAGGFITQIQLVELRLVPGCCEYFLHVCTDGRTSINDDRRAFTYQLRRKCANKTASEPGHSPRWYRQK